MCLGEHGKSALQGNGRANLDQAVTPADLLQLGYMADIEQVAQIAALLGDPQSHVGAAGQDVHARLGLPQRGKRRYTARGIEVRTVGTVVERLLALQAAQRLGYRLWVQPARWRYWQGQHAQASLDNRAVAGTAAQVAGQRVAHGLARKRRSAGLVLLVQ